MAVRIQTGPLSVDRAYRALSDPASGGVVVFAGRVRAEPAGGARRIVALEYEAHRPLAEKGLRGLEALARRKYRIHRVVLWHRTGTLRIGVISVIVGVAAPHREAAFAAAAWMIAELKVRVPIWKTDRARSARRPRPRPRRRAGRSAD